jgi:hypothetical protein
MEDRSTGFNGGIEGEGAAELSGLRCLKKTFASSAAPFQHLPSQRIRSTYSPGSCWSLKKLPAVLSPTSVHSAQTISATENSFRRHEPQKTTKQTDYFTPLNYGFSEYNSHVYEEKRANELRELNLISFSRKPFQYSSSKVRLKHEDIMDNENFVYPTLGPSDGSKRAGRALKPIKPAFGLFRPGGRASREQRAREESREFVSDWSRRMFAALAADWPQLRFKLQFTAAEEFLFQFSLPRGQEEALAGPLNKYMKHFAAHGLAAEFRLIKRGDRWNCVEPAALEGEGALGSSSSIREKEEEDRESDVLLVVYSFFAPWVTAASVRARRLESLRGRATSRTAAAADAAAAPAVAALRAEPGPEKSRSTSAA